MLALAATLLAAPNPLIVRSVVDEVPAIEWAFLRFVLMSVVLLPMIVFAKRRTVKRGGHRSLALSAVVMPVAIIFYCLAIAASQASYVSIILLLSPIVLVVLSQLIFGEKVSRRMTTGLSLAFGGALLLVLAPFLVQHGSIDFYPLATVYALLNVLLFAIAVIYTRKANEAGYSMPVVIGWSALCGVVLTGAYIVFSGGSIIETLQLGLEPRMTLPLVYSALVVALLTRALSVIAFEHIGAAMSGGINYLGSFVAIILPVFILGESLSIPMILGGALIVFGVLIVENTLPRHHHKHHRTHMLHIRHDT